LGEGSFGKTYEAVRSESVAGSVVDQEVALKVLKPDLLNSPSKRLQFVQERTALSRLRHANLIHSIKCGEDNGEVYFAMELCKGGDLPSLVKHFGALPERVAALIGMQAAAGLREMHRREMVHRDIKPANIMIFEPLSQNCTLDEITHQLEENESLCRIVDFGLVGTIISAQGATGHAAHQKFVGSMMYASPEQILERKSIDGRTDIYALGMTLWYLVQGRGPLLDARGDELKHATEAEGRHLSSNEHEPDLPNNLSQEFRGILARMVAKRPEDRMPNAKDLAVALHRYLERSARVRGVGFPPVPSRKGIQSFYIFSAESLKSIGRKRFAAENCASRVPARLTIVEDLDDISKIRPDFNEAVKKICDLAQTLQQPDVPPALLPVQEVVWAADALAYAEDVPGDVTLAEVLQARTAARRPISFREAEVIFRPIAEALDYLINHGWDLISLPCEDVWLSDAVTADAAPSDRKVLCRPLDEWDGLRVTFSGMWVPPEKGRASGADISFASTSQGGSSFITAESLRPPVSAFLRLVYRTLSGSDVPDAADRWQNGYIPSVSLQNSSNNLIRDLLCKQREWSSVSLILNELCANEGVSVNAPVIPMPDRSGIRTRGGTTNRVTTGGKATATPVGSTGSSSATPPHSAGASTTGPSADAQGEGPSPREAREALDCEIISLGVVRLGDHIQELPPIEWVSKEFIKCAETGNWFFFPHEGRDLHEGRVEQLKHVLSPYTNAEQEVEWADWQPGGQIICAQTGHAFLLPNHLPFPTGSLPAEGTGRIISYFDPQSAPITVSPADWMPGVKITCPTTGHVFVLPEQLPPLEAMVDVRKVGWVASPYDPEAPWTIPTTDWFAGQEIICNSTRKTLTLPREVEQWVAEAIVVDVAAREVRSPYHADFKCVVKPMEWCRGGSINCPPAGRPARLPMDLPLLIGQVLPGTPGVIRSPFSGDTIKVPYPSWITGREIVCPKSGQPFLLPPGLPVPDGSVLPDKPGLAFSPYDPSRTVKVEPLHWHSGEVLTCPTTGERFKLPEKLPLLLAILTPGEPGLVRSPFATETNDADEANSGFNVPIDDWVAGNSFDCPVTKHIFILPPGIEEWIKDGSWVPGAPGKVRSPFRNGSEIELKDSQWKPGALVTCAVSKRRFRVPVTEGFPTLALEKAAVQFAHADPDADEKAAVSALKKDHPGASEEVITGIWTRHHLETVEKRLPKENGMLVEDEPGFVISPYNQKRMAVPPETWVLPGGSLLCETGLRFLLPPDRPHLIGSVDEKNPGVVKSPFPSDDPVRVKPWQWLPGTEIIGGKSGHPFVLPAKLPAWVPEAALDARKPGNVINPFSQTDESIPIDGRDWISENSLTVGGQRYKLPKKLPPLVASLDRAVRGKVESPYAPGRIIVVKPDAWLPRSVVTCTKTQREFLLPDALPDDPFEGIDPHEDGTIQSPYGKGNRFEVLALEWLGEAIVRCPETDKRVVLPKTLPLLIGEIDPDRPCEVRSPFDHDAWMRLAVENWTEGREVTCAKTQRTFRLPKGPLPLPFAELAAGKPGAVHSPFRDGAEILVPPMQWIEGGEVEDRTARKRFRLPLSNLPLLEGVQVAGHSLVVKSPFDPKAEVPVSLDDWIPGHEVTCPTTERVFALPQHLEEPVLPARLVEGRPGWIVNPYTNVEFEVPGPAWIEKAVILSAEGRQILLPAKLPPLPAILIDGSPLQIQSPYDPDVLETVAPRKWTAGTIIKCGGRSVQLPAELPPLPPGVSRISPFPLAAMAGITACLLLAGGLAAWQFGWFNASNPNKAIAGLVVVPSPVPVVPEPPVVVPVTPVVVPVTPVVVPEPSMPETRKAMVQESDLLEKVRLIDATATNDQITDEDLNTCLAAYQVSSTEVFDLLVKNVGRLTSPMFVKALATLKPEHTSRFISAGKECAANKEVAATSWYLDAGQQQKSKGDAAPEVLTAYHEAATRDHAKAAEWLCERVIAKTVPNSVLKVIDPYSSKEKFIDISPENWEPDRIIREHFFRLGNELPPLVARFDDSKHHLPDGDKKGIIGDPYGDPSSVIEVDHKEWYRGAVFKSGKIVLPDDLPLMPAKFNAPIMEKIVGEKTAYIGSPVSDADVSISWKQWKPGEIIKEKLSINGSERDAEVAVMPADTNERNPMLPADASTWDKRRIGDVSQGYRYEYTITSPYTSKTVAVPVSLWVLGDPAPEPELKNLGVQVSMLLPKSDRKVFGWISATRTFSYFDENGVKKDIPVPDDIMPSALTMGFKDSKTGALYAVEEEAKPRISKSDKNSYVNLFTGERYNLKELASLARKSTFKYNLDPEVKSDIDTASKDVRVTSKPSGPPADSDSNSKSEMAGNSAGQKKPETGKPDRTPESPSSKVVATPTQSKINQPAPKKTGGGHYSASLQKQFIRNPETGRLETPPGTITGMGKQSAADAFFARDRLLGRTKGIRGYEVTKDGKVQVIE